MERIAYKQNPQTICAESVQAVTAGLTGHTDEDLTKLLSGRLNHRTYEIPFSDILHPEFDAFRLGSVEWVLPITDEDRQQLGTTETAILPTGPESITAEELYYERFNKADTEGHLYGQLFLRAFISTVYVEEAQRQNKPIPDINYKIIDAPAVRKSLIDGATASGQNMFLIDGDDLEQNWQQQNPEFHKVTMELINSMVTRYTPITRALYEGILPTEYLDQRTEDIHNAWKENLWESAVRTYAWFQPEQPRLIPVPEEKKVQAEDFETV